MATIMQSYITIIFPYFYMHEYYFIEFNWYISDYKPLIL